MRFLSVTVTFACVVLAGGLCTAQEKVTIPDNIMKDMEHYIGTWVGEYTMADKECVPECDFPLDSGRRISLPE